MATIGAMLALLLTAEAQPAPNIFDRAPNCPSLSEVIAVPCVVPTTFGPQAAEMKLGDRDYVWWIEGDQLTMIARPKSQPWMVLCCTIQTPLEPIAGSALAAIKVRVPRIDEAVLDIFASPSETSREEVYRGFKAKAAPERLDPPANRLLTEFIPSKWLGEERAITIYLPPGYRSSKVLPIFYLADSQAWTFAPIAEAAIAKGTMPPVIMVGIASAPGAISECSGAYCDRRGWEYKMDRNDGDISENSPFGRHMRFVTDEVMPLVERRYLVSRRASDRIVGGSSNGAHWALAMAALRPDLFGKVMLLSSSGRDPQALGSRLGRARVYGGAGQFEADYLEHTRAAVRAAAAAGADTHMTVEVSGHNQSAWDMMFAEAAPWLLKMDKRKSDD